MNALTFMLVAPLAGALIGLAVGTILVWRKRPREDDPQVHRPTPSEAPQQTLNGHTEQE